MLVLWRKGVWEMMSGMCQLRFLAQNCFFLIGVTGNYDGKFRKLAICKISECLRLIQKIFLVNTETCVSNENMFGFKSWSSERNTVTLSCWNICSALITWCISHGTAQAAVLVSAEGSFTRVSPTKMCKMCIAVAFAVCYFYFLVYKVGYPVKRQKQETLRKKKKKKKGQNNESSL